MKNQTLVILGNSLNKAISEKHEILLKITIEKNKTFDIKCGGNSEKFEKETSHYIQYLNGRYREYCAVEEELYEIICKIKAL